MRNFLKNKTFYDIGIGITAGEARESVCFRHVFLPSRKAEGIFLTGEPRPSGREGATLRFQQS
jgi:hypothetical protein